MKTNVCYYTALVRCESAMDTLVFIRETYQKASVVVIASAELRTASQNHVSFLATLKATLPL